MKKIILLFAIALIVSVNNLKAQTVHPIQDYFTYLYDNNVYFKDVNNIFPKFLGTWEYNGEDKYLKITLTKYERVQKNPLVTTLIQYSDEIIVDFLYKEKVNNQWIVRYDTYGSNYAYISYLGVDSLNTIAMFYREPQITGTCERQRHGDLTLTYSLNTSGTPQLQWIRENITLGHNPNEPCPDGTPRDASDFIIPENMVLTKVN